MSDSIDDHLMSSSSPEPENAAPAGTVRTEQDQQRSRDGDQVRRPWSRTSLSNSSSLLTRALAGQNEAVQKISKGAVAHDSTNASENSLRQSAPSTAQNANNGVSSAHNIERGSEMIAAVVPGSAGAAFGAASLRAMAASSASTLHEMSQFNNMLTSHRELLNGTRGRGTSLERTEKEKRVGHSPKGKHSTNPGDTALPTSPEIPSPSNIDSNNPPTEGVRARYRSWRDVRSSTAAGKAWSIGEEGSDVSYGQVEKSITEAMTGAEPNSRSRKASHSLRFFKEGLPEDMSKKRDTKSRGRSKEGTSRLKSDAGKQKPEHEAPTMESTGAGELQPSQVCQRPGSSPLERSTSTAAFNQTSYDTNLAAGLAAEEGYFDPSHGIKAMSTEQVKAMPAQLLAEIRKQHNLTPGAAKGSSFSRSIPVTVSERSISDVEHQDIKSLETAGTEIEDDSNQDGTDLIHTKSNEEEDESGEEQISSALFVPHHTPHESPEKDHHGLESVVRPRLGDQKREPSNSQQWLEEHKVPSREVVKKYLSQEAHSRPLPIRSSSYAKQHTPHVDKEILFSDIIPSNHVTTDDEGLTTAGEESGGADTLDTTPAGSVKPTDQFPADYTQHFHDHQNESKQPLEAIELIPYRHQVGGHTTMWRFSKRAVCKQLNNRENEFYEKVERYHPHLLKFLPRYIGVLNVTFEKQSRRKSARKDEADGVSERQEIPQDAIEGQSENKVAPPRTVNGHELKYVQTDQPRIVSQSLHSSSVPIPTVTFADNRHIIPKSFMHPQPHLIDVEHRSNSDSATITTGKSAAPVPSSDFDGARYRPTVSDKHATSWGATTVNKQLRNQVFGEAFLQQPIPIQRHKKPASQHRSLPSRHRGSNLRNSNSESSLKAAQQSQQGLNAQAPEESIRRKAMKAAAERQNVLTPVTSTEPEQTEGAANADEEDTEFYEKAGTSAPDPEITRSSQEKRQRRYSSGALRRKPAEVAADRGDLKYFEEADDAGYKGDVDDDVFPMDIDASEDRTWPSDSHEGPPAQLLRIEESWATEDSEKGRSKLTPPISTHEPSSNLLDAPRPVNPKEAQTQPDSRVEYFLLLEDLTAGMKRPCIMDLKMGTRQYGVDANEKKQKSQQRKCAATTSKELGVRVCGVQVWDVKTQSYIFQDKYFGRDLKAGREFQDALTRFLYDGVNYTSILRHIPTILEKLSRLEVLIQGLAGYRFYAASLLLFYDGDTQRADESDSTATEKDAREKEEIDFKIADFANCVTREDFRSGDKPCPPRHPDQPDKGFLRGLRSLKNYFMAIQRETHAKELGRMPERLGNGHNGAVSEGSDLDESGISY